MKSITNITLLILLLTITFSFAQQSKTRGESFAPLDKQTSSEQSRTSRTIDSLENILRSAKEDANKANILNRLCWEYKDRDLKKALEYCDQGLSLASRLEFSEGVARSLNNIGEVNRLKGNYKKAIDHHLQSLEIRRELGDKKEIANCLNNIGIVCYNQSKYEKAIDYYLQAIKISEETGDQRGIATRLNNIAGIYYYQGNYQKAMDYYRQSLEIRTELGDKRGITSCLLGIGNVYYSQDNYEKAVNYFFQSLKINKELGNKKGISKCLNNIAGFYNYQENYEKAIEYLLQSLAIDEELGNKHGIALILNNIGALFSKLGYYDKSREYSERSLMVAKEIGAKDEIKQAYANLAETYAGKEQFKKAYEYHQLYFEITDSLFNEESSRQITEMQTKYETEKKELQIENLNKEKELQAVELKKNRIMMFAFAGGLALVLILAFVIFRSYRQSKKAKEIIEEKNKDITDSIRYAQSIQQAILPKEAEIRKAIPDHFIYFQPRDIVSGDFYWFYAVASPPLEKPDEAPAQKVMVSPSKKRGSGGVFLVAADCTGHGVPGAFVSMIGNDLLNQIIIEKGVENPGEILTHLNNGIKSVFTREGAEQEAQDGMDMVLCVFDKDLKTLEFAGAKNPLLIIQNGELKQIKGDKYPIGGETERNYKFTNHQTDLQKGNMVYMFSDGYQDQFGGSKDLAGTSSYGAGKKFMIKRFKELLLTIQDKPMQEQKEILDKTIKDWKGNNEQVDDILVIGIRV
ncbi:MAG: tetratricopeptide repeat protein [Bacteroidota bacterium]